MAKHVNMMEASLVGALGPSPLSP